MSIHWSKLLAPIAAIGGSLLGGPVGGMLGSAVGNLFGGGSSSPGGGTFPPPQADPSSGSSFMSGIGNLFGSGSSGGAQGASSMLPALGSVGAGALNYEGQMQTNAANAKMAQNQMDFQANQSATSWQRGVKDMQAAGLNPMLAYSQGGASSMQGSTATMGNALAAGTSGAMDAARTIQDVQSSQKAMEQVDANIAKTNAETRTELNRPENILADTFYKKGLPAKTLAEIDEIGTRANLNQAATTTEREKPRLVAAQAASAEADPDLKSASAWAARKSADYSIASARQADATTENIKLGYGSTRARSFVDDQSVESDIQGRRNAGASSLYSLIGQGLKVPGQAAEARFADQVGVGGPWGRAIAGGLNSAANAARSLRH